MLGNDIVDLAAIAEIRHARFDERVFRPAERDALAATPESERLRWILWAAKESAYKALRRLDRCATFVPIRFAVSLDAAHCAPGKWVRVAHGQRSMRVRIETGASLVHAVAWSDPRAVATTLSAAVAADAIAPGATLHEAVRELARDHIADALRLRAEELEISRKGRIPRIEYRGATLPAALSLSHDGRFVAFACQFAQRSLVRVS